MSRQTTLWLLLFPALAGLSSCGLSSSQTDASGSCSGGCGFNAAWPRVIVGVIPPEGSQRDGAELVTMTGTDRPGGNTVEGYAHGCPADVDDAIICSYSFPGSPDDESLRVDVRDLDGTQLVQFDVPLKEFNRCAIDIAYVSILLNDDQPPEVSDVRYVTPCSGALDPG